MINRPRETCTTPRIAPRIERIRNSSLPICLVSNMVARFKSIIPMTIPPMINLVRRSGLIAMKTITAAMP